jgi:hypothetical protein
MGDNLSVNLDTATRATIVTAGCCALYNLKRTSQIGDWRAAAADLDMPALLDAAAQLGISFYSGGHPFTLPQPVITPKRSS